MIRPTNSIWVAALMTFSGLVFGQVNPTQSPKVSIDELSKTQLIAKASSGDLEAQNLLARNYLGGNNGFRCNRVKAVKWFLKAAKAGSYDAQEMLGHCYDQGWGVKPNQSKAAKWYRLAALQSDPWASWNLAIQYYRGIGVKQNYAEALVWFILARKGEPNFVSSEPEEAASHLSPELLEKTKIRAEQLQLEIEEKLRKRGESSFFHSHGEK